LPNVSVVIPVLNERACLPATLAALENANWVHEVIVVDGGSTDGTREWLAGQALARVVDSPAGKGRQLNAGAKVATGDVLLFLHGDCLAPREAGPQMRKALEARVVGGCFCVQFPDARPLSLRLVAAGMNLRARLTHTATGDQAIFVRREVFERAGGFPDWPLFEDVELVRRAKQLGEFAVVPARVTLSPRRHLRGGVLRTVFLVYALRLGFWAGLSPSLLKRWFADVRPHLRSQIQE